jgi:hypothetical protein
VAEPGPRPEAPTPLNRPDDSPTSVRRAWAVLAALMLGYAALFVAYYPPIAGVEDEVGFINQALVWSRGAVTAEGAGWPCGLADFMEYHGRHVPTRHPGRSLVALPFLAVGGVTATFASGLLLHLAMTAAGGALLARLGRSPLWAALVLFHPTLALYSRTVMADGPAGAGLLLAALAVVSDAPVAAGLAVGLAAAMRHHSALALPIVAGSFVYPRAPACPVADSRRWPRATVCVLAGGAVGSALVAYNLAVYGTLTEPFTARRGVFAASFVIPHLTFYAAALMVIWPGMLLAPLLDRSRLRWLVRGVIVVFLGPLLFYYFHDRADRWIETAVLGQRLIQVALPLWVVSYAGVVDDLVATPLRRRLGTATFRGLTTLTCVGLLAATALLFARHQAHLRVLRQARDAVAARVPDGALIFFSGSFYKIVGTPSGVPYYRLQPLDWMGTPYETPEHFDRNLARTPGPWYVAVQKHTPAEPPPPFLRALIGRHRLVEVPLGSPLVSLYAPPSGETPP